MANPAELLHRLLISWSGSPSISTRNVRQDEELKEHRRAIGYLESIDEALTLMERDGLRVSPYRKHYSIWVKAVFHFPRHWEGANKGAIPSDSLDHLETLIDKVEEIAPVIEVDRIPILLLYLSAVEKALDDDKTLPPAVTAQVKAAVTSIRDYVENLDSVDSFDFEKAIRNLFSLLAFTVMQSRERERWEGWADNFVWMGFGDLFSRATEKASELVPYAEVLQAITAGG